MQLALLILFGIPIAIADLAYHRIPNIYLRYLVLPAILLTWPTDWSALLAIFAFWLSLHFLTGLGMGDVKFLTLLALVLGLNSFSRFALYLSILFLFASFHAGIVLLRKRRFKAQIPLAPASIAASVLYLCAPWAQFLPQ